MKTNFKPQSGQKVRVEGVPRKRFIVVRTDDKTLFPITGIFLLIDFSNNYYLAPVEKIHPVK